MKFVIEQSKAYKLNLGFTLIELMVTVGIFVFMTALLLAKYNSYYSGTIFKNQAYDVAITLRQAQSFGISVKADPGNVNTPTFGSAYGVNFPNAGITDFNLFSYRGNPVNGFNNVGTEKNYKLKYGAYFAELKVSTDGTNYSYADNVDIVFQRPNPEAIICAKVGVRTCNVYKYVDLVMKSQNNVIKTIKINSSGQISIVES